MRRPFGVLLSAACLLACGTTNPADETATGATATAADTTGPTTGTGAGTGTDASTGSSSDPSTGPTTGGTSDPGEAQCQADLQDCPDGFKCVLRRGAADWEFVCLPVQGDNAAGDSCHHDGVIAGTDDCDEASWCIGSFDTTGAPWEGLCYPLCVGDVCGNDQRCVSIGALPVCAPVCDPCSPSAAPPTRPASSASPRASCASRRASTATRSARTARPRSAAPRPALRAAGRRLPARLVLLHRLLRLRERREHLHRQGHGRHLRVDRRHRARAGPRRRVRDPGVNHDHARRNTTG
ncbi:hypothetical protein [Nannocystis pusilla]|uniref:hypothetical protein n=1 Tax=Nannocystis pusilla TaxID=889268 RepID=UPI003B798729